MKAKQMLVIEANELTEELNLQYNLAWDIYDLYECLGVEDVDYTYYNFSRIYDDMEPEMRCLNSYLQDVFPNECELIIKL